MPAYNAEHTVRKTHSEVVAHDCVDAVILVDDSSSDRTATIAAGLERTTVIRHPENRGYGGNQKTCYETALEHGADIVVMVHPDYQYTPKILPAMVTMIESGLYDCVLGSRILGGHARHGGMPIWRYVANRFLTLAQNMILGAKLSEYHTGYRAFSRELLEELPLDANSDGFVFDNQMLAQTLWSGFKIAEVSCPTRYATDASSINFRRSVQYGFGCLATSIESRLAGARVIRSARFPLRSAQ
ncbi:MAG: glycosyltransferase family 2 protein [Acidimicrobiales bacterium]|nr:glycosyltransferase family 2 protein [Acidimicrobiales bacterium]RZV48809.1 MAG: glycosyltransferase family 2 protein [Acidimicrobiales bacterium]